MNLQRICQECGRLRIERLGGSMTCSFCASRKGNAGKRLSAAAAKERYTVTDHTRCEPGGQLCEECAEIWNEVQPTKPEWDRTWTNSN